jgi:DNA-binding MarR family transcriptional regulator
MNEKASTPYTDELLGYQVGRLKGLIEEIVHCCQTRTAYLSQRFDLPQAELRCLMLFHDEKYLTVKGIAKKLEVAKSRVTKIVEGLTRRSLVESIDDPQDARIRLISLTPSGKAKYEEMDRVTTDLHRKILLELSAEERRSTLVSLESLRVSMEIVKKELV